jgi:thiosulfate/3-mercaptopyruvate sulfurtransferase
VRSPLISAEELHRALRSEDRPTLLDVRWKLGGPPGIEEYRAGHIPGAVFVDLDTELSAPAGPAGRHPLPHADRFAADMRAAGVSNGRHVIAYDEADSMAAARAWWVLRYFGHRRVSVLNGGLAAWIAAGYELETDAVIPRPGDFGASPGGMPLLDADGAASLAGTGVLLDARAPERFAGESEPVDPVAGHIPQARNRPSAENVEADGSFRDADQLRAGFAGVGVADGVQIGAYCGSGVSAAHEVLALELAGYRAALYPGSWSEWVTDPARPVATGRPGAAATGR